MSENPFRAPGSPPSMLSGLTHELRTPLNSILIMAELLAEAPDGALAEREARYARNIQQATRDLLDLVDQAGEIGRIESGRTNVEARTVATADLARRIEEDHREAAAAAETPLTVGVAAEAPATVVTDPAKVMRAVALLVAAALQASKGGEVTVTLAAGAGPGLDLAVTDAGPAPTEAEIAALFVPFGSAGPRTARRFGGTGLGLSIAWGLARQLGADLAAEPAGPSGCRFVLSLPGPA